MQDKECFKCDSSISVEIYCMIQYTLLWSKMRDLWKWNISFNVWGKRNHVGKKSHDTQFWICTCLYQLSSWYHLEYSLPYSKRYGVLAENIQLLEIKCEPYWIVWVIVTIFPSRARVKNSTLLCPLKMWRYNRFSTKKNRVML